MGLAAIAAVRAAGVRGHKKSGCGGQPGCHTPTMTGDGFLGTHNNGDDLGLILGMVYGIGVCHIP